MLGFEEGGGGGGGTGVPEEKPLGERGRTNHKISLRMVSTPGFEPVPVWWEAKYSHHCGR